MLSTKIKQVAGAEFLGILSLMDEQSSTSIVMGQVITILLTKKSYPESINESKMLMLFSANVHTHNDASSIPGCTIASDAPSSSPSIHPSSCASHLNLVITIPR